MPFYIRVALAIDLLLCAVEHGAPTFTQGLLPLGGSEFVELAVLLLIGVAANELFAKRKEAPHDAKDEDDEEAHRK